MKTYCRAHKGQNAVINHEGWRGGGAGGEGGWRGVGMEKSSAVFMVQPVVSPEKQHTRDRAEVLACPSW